MGGAIGSWWLRRKAVHYYTSTQSERHNRFVELLVTLLVRLAEIDGPINRNEVAAIRQFFQRDLGYRDERLIWVRDLIKLSRESHESAEEVCGELRQKFGLQERLIALQVLTRVAQADGHFDRTEKEFIERVATALGLEPFLAGFSGQAGYGGGGGGAGARPRSAGGRSVDAALSTLGLSRGADGEEIKKAWRKLSMENHPDRVAHLGDEFRTLAEQRMREINGAYDTLKGAGLAR